MPNTAYDFLAMIGFCSLGYFIIRILFYFQIPKQNGKELSDTSACLITLLMIIIGICTLPVTAILGLLDSFTMNKARDVMEQSIQKEAHETWSPFSESNKKMCEQARQEGYDEGTENGYTTGYDDGYDTGYSEGYILGRDNGHKEDLLTNAFSHSPRRYMRSILKNYDYNDKNDEIYLFELYISAIIYYPTIAIAKKYDLDNLLEKKVVHLSPAPLINSSEFHEILSNIFDNLECKLKECWETEALEDKIICLNTSQNILNEYTKIAHQSIKNLYHLFIDDPDHNNLGINEILNRIIEQEDFGVILSNAILQNISFVNNSLSSNNFTTTPKEMTYDKARNCKRFLD